MRKNFKSGISLVEIIIVFAVLAVILAVVIPRFGVMRERQVLKSAVSDILSILNKAQGQSIASVDSSTYGVHFEADKVVIFKGTSYVDGNGGNEEINLTTPAEISNVTLAGVSATSGSMYFNRISGSPNKAGTITVSTPSFNKIITISATGGVSAN